MMPLNCEYERALITRQPATLHSSESKAQMIADRCNDDDGEWSYRVEARKSPLRGRGAWFAIVVSDENGKRLGDL
jgi:hypothetical protein